MFHVNIFRYNINDIECHVSITNAINKTDLSGDLTNLYVKLDCSNEQKSNEEKYYSKQIKKSKKNNPCGG